MANLDELIQKLSEKSKALTYDSGRWDSTQLAKKTKELTELLPAICTALCDALDAKPGSLKVDGHFDADDIFHPNEGQPTLNEAIAFMQGGGIVYLHVKLSDVDVLLLASTITNGKIEAYGYNWVED